MASRFAGQNSASDFKTAEYCRPSGYRNRPALGVHTRDAGTGCHLGQNNSLDARAGKRKSRHRPRPSASPSRLSPRLAPTWRLKKNVDRRAGRLLPNSRRAALPRARSETRGHDTPAPTPRGECHSIGLFDRVRPWSPKCCWPTGFGRVGPGATGTPIAWQRSNF